MGRFKLACLQSCGSRYVGLFVVLVRLICMVSFFERVFCHLGTCLLGERGVGSRRSSMLDGLCEDWHQISCYRE